ncbi:MAG: nucleoside-diphosphate sugar epimerase/dehydratase [Dehalococcoidia bacterium]|nr:polysaccharide biosynthesis protein [Dehalococcoidia bacterium]MCB9486912.1 polysaccharide biosynthesis protein [Thermoflexaceae bacterium]
MSPSGVRRWLNRLLPGEPLDTAVAMLLDIAAVCISYTAALLLRFEANVPSDSVHLALWLVPLLGIAFVAANVFLGVYRTVWAFGGLADILLLFRPVALVTAVVFLIHIGIPDRDLPLSVVLMAGALIFPLMAFVKMRTRLLLHTPWGSTASRRLLIVGAGHTGQALARELQSSPGLRYQPMGYLDDDAKKHHRRMLGLRVYGPLSSLEKVVADRAVDAIAIAIGQPAGPLVRDLVGRSQQLGVPIRMVPGVDHWVSGGNQGGMRDITLEDLLGRDPVEVDYERCAASVSGKVVLVTGAAGSIGSELCRQVLRFGPRELHLLDNNETGLFDLSLELRRSGGETVHKSWVADVVEHSRVRKILTEVMPDVVYHAAAYKHVPLMEEHPVEAFRVNVHGTLNVASLSRELGVGTFVLISTDKAVRPTSVMGATKRVAELLVLALSGTATSTRFAVVRFGNVMGSRGSVVPIFMRQIENGGPVTVMHPDMMRYFISIPEAVSLVIQAGAFGGHGQVYMLDMGDEVNILELAERMIRLRGLRPGDDIQVVFTGPRPGEKLREELVADFESMEPTEHPKVMRLASSVEVTESEILRLVEETEGISGQDDDELRRRIHLVVRKFSTGPEGSMEGVEVAR